jgi:hypothetical protein
MSRLPDATDLLHTARAALLEKLLPALPADLHYDARMIANALAIAARESAAPAPNQLLNERDLAVAIRAGEHDRGTARASLLALTRAKLAVSNPRLLESYARLFD